MFKIILLGNSNAGKTSIANRFISDKFESDYKATIAADFNTKLLNISGNEIRLQVWDLVGMDTSYMALNRRFCRDASGVIMVADITNESSIEDTARWKQEVDEIVSTADSPIPIVLCLNKMDLIAEGQEASEL